MKLLAGASIVLVVAVTVAVALTASAVDLQQANVRTTAAAWALMTPTQRAHASFHASRGSASRYKIIDDKISVDSISDRAGSESLPGSTQAIQDLACKADVVIRGTVVDFASFPIESGTFLFTDYSFRIGEVLRSRAGVAMSPGSEVIVTRPGGRLTVDGVVVSASINIAPMLEANGAYVLFLTYLPDTGTYLSPAVLPTFSFAQTARALGGRPFVADRDLGRDGLAPGQLIAIVRAASC